MVEATPLTVETERWREVVEKGTEVSYRDLWNFSEYLLRSRNGDNLSSGSYATFIHEKFRYGFPHFELAYAAEHRSDDNSQRRERILLEYDPSGSFDVERYRLIKNPSGDVRLARARGRGFRGFVNVYSPLAGECVGEDYEEVVLTPAGRKNFLRNLWNTSQSVIPEIPMPESL